MSTIELRGSRRSLALAVAIGALGLLVRFAALDRGMKTHDEHLSTYVAAGGQFIDFRSFSSADVYSLDLTDLMARSARLENGNARLYNLLLHGWIRLFGRGDAATRGLSVLLGGLTVPLLFFLVERLLGSRASAAAASLLLALHPLHVSFSVTSRGYAAATFLWSAATWLLVELVRRREKRSWFAVPYVACCLGGFFCHFLSLYLFGAHAVLAAVALLARWRVGVLITAQAVVLAGIVAWLAGAGAADTSRIAEKNRMWLARAAQREANAELMSARTGMRKIVETYVDYAGLSVHWTALSAGVRPRYLLPLLALPVGLAVLSLGAGQGSIPFASWFLIIAACSPLAFAAASAVSAGHTVSFWPQYTVFGVPFLCALAGAGISERNARQPLGVAARCGFVVLASSLALGVLDESMRPRIDNPFIEANRALVAKHEPGDVVLYPNATVAHYNALYLSSPTPVLQGAAPEKTAGYRVVLRRSNGSEVLLVDLAEVGFPWIDYYRSEAEW